MNQEAIVIICFCRFLSRISLLKLTFKTDNVLLLIIQSMCQINSIMTNVIPLLFVWIKMHTRSNYLVIFI